MGACDRLKKCRYCSGEARQIVRQGRNFIGTMGFVSECYCTRCKKSVFAWATTEEEALEQSESYWNRGTYNAKQE